MSEATLLKSAPIPFATRCHAHLAIMRLDHSVKQIFIVPGIVIAVTLSDTSINILLAWHIVLGLVATTAIASSNYVLNEILDAPFDRLHRINKVAQQPVAQCISLRDIFNGSYWALWIIAGTCGFDGVDVERPVLWIMDVFITSPCSPPRCALSRCNLESVNNPLRFCAGWYIVTFFLLPYFSVILYWMLGAYSWRSNASVNTGRLALR